MILDRGSEIEKYVVEGVLGEGGMAAVYRVRHRTLGSVFALKVLTVPNRKIRDRMIQEGQIQATIRHANVVQVVDVLDVNGMTGLLMEFVAGPPLDQLLQQHTLSLEDALVVFGGLLAGVDAAHKRGLVHRDLKPENVLMRLGDDGVTPKIADFGIAKAAEEGTQHSTRPGAAMGTPAYMAPEQVRDASTVTPSADVYSLGCILYELTTGYKAFPGDHALDILNAVVKGEVVPCDELRPDLPTRVVDAIQGAMRVDPTQRIQTVAELAAVLFEQPADAVIESLPTRLSLSSPAAQMARSMAKRTPTPVPARRRGPNSSAGEHDTLFPEGSAEHAALDAEAVAPTAGRRQTMGSLPPGSPRATTGGESAAVRMAKVGLPLVTAVAVTVGILVVGGLGLAWFLSRGAPPEPEPVAEVVPEPEPEVAPEPEPEVAEAGADDTAAAAAEGEGEGEATEAAADDGAAAGTEAGATKSGGTGGASRPKVVTTNNQPGVIQRSIAELTGQKDNPTPKPKVDPAIAQSSTPMGVIPTAEPPDDPKGRSKDRPARVKLEPPATKVMLQSGEEWYAGTGRIPPGTYIIHVWYDTPVSKPQGRIQLQPGASITLLCRPEWTYCQTR